MKTRKVKIQELFSARHSSCI